MPFGGGRNDPWATRVILFMLAFNIAYPVMLYTFTSLNFNAYSPVSIISKDYFQSKGMIISKEVVNNITINSDLKYYLFNGTNYRAGWDSSGFYIQSQSWIIDKLFNTWFSPYNLFVESTSNQWMTNPPTMVHTSLHQYVSETTLLYYYNSAYNLTQGDLYDGLRNNMGVSAFWSFNPHVYATFGQALSNGHVILIFGEKAISPTLTNAYDFVTWYMSIIIGANTYGLPIVFTWLTDLLIALSILSVVFILW
jgi:hypothetical protein